MVEWAKNHPYLAGATVVGLLILIIVMRNRSAASAAAAAAPSSGAYGPSDQLQAAEMAYGVQALQAQLGANVAQSGYAAQTQQAAYQGQVQLAQIGAQQTVGSDQIAAALQLGLAQTAAPLALAGATAQVSQTPTGIVFGAAQNTAQQIAAATAASNTLAAVATAPAPSAFAPQPGTIGGTLPSSTPQTCPAGMHWASGACIYDPSNTTGPGAVAAQWSVSQANQAIWSAASGSQCQPAWWVAMNGNPNGSPICP